MKTHTHSPACLLRISMAIVLGALAAGAPFAKAQEAKRIGEVRWSELKAAGKLTAGEVVNNADATPSEQLVVEVPKDSPQLVHLCTLDDPGVGPPAYVLRGSVKYEDISSQGYLEMWNYFPDGSYFFTRTLGSVGPMAALTGTSDWRAIELPFMINLPDPAAREKMRPNKLVVNLVLPTGGKVALSNLELAQYDDAALGGMSLSGGWWSSRTGGIIGATLGTMFGLFGAAIGVLSSLSRSARLVKGLLVFCAILGAGMLAVGAIAMLLGQPWAVSGPFLIAGLPATLVPLLLLPNVQRQFQARELRRMQALDVGV